MFKFLTTTAIVAMAIPVAANAQAQAPRVVFDIKASDTATALNAFARQAGVHVSFPYDAVANRRAAALRGRFTRDEALRRLIAGQGLMIAEETPSMIALKVIPVETPQVSQKPRPPIPRGRISSCSARASRARCRRCRPRRWRN
ncbi:STN domain-containing protein [Sphingomonas sp. OK281]|uniref:STN domain-containing protein n=1 Tax=Sphingomonas sp. OK281 TaxID=1881067 RepID=UPI001C31785F|nr:STN domain-containing protein [Sphingomonas sp. OK281]